MNMLNKLAIGVIALAVLALGLRFLVIKIEPGEVGVVNAEWTGGLVEQDYRAGYHWSIGPFHTWTVFDTTVQTLHMHRNAERAARNDDAEIEAALSVKSSDGASITLDVSLKYRIKPGKVLDLFKLHGSQERYQERVRNTSRDVLRLSLGELRAESFYDPLVRQDVVAKMEADLRGQLEAQHVELIGILIRDLEFEPSFEERIKRKTVASEEQALNVAQTLAEEMLGRTNKIVAETGAKVVVIHQEKAKTLRSMRAENDKTIAEITAIYKKKVQELQSDADLYAALKEADGIKLLRDAEAQGQALRRSALSSTGGTVLVALEIARNLKLGEMSVSTQATNPLDVNAMMERFGIPAEAAPK